MPQRDSILIVGSLPPPAIGPYLAIERLVSSRELNAAFDIRFVDISDHRSPSNIGRFDARNVFLGLKHALICLARLVSRRRQILYVSIAQGTWGYLRDLAFILPALCLRTPVVIHLRGSEFGAFYQQMPGWLRYVTRFVLARTARMIVLGEGLRKTFDGLLAPSQIAVIPNGIRYQEYERSPVTGAAPFRKKILFLASLRRRKGVFVLLEALPQVLARHPDAQVTFAGSWRSNQERKEAEQLIEELRLSGRCRFVGEVSGQEKVRTYLDHDLFVFPPIEPEGLPWVILEAMSAALPVITTDQGAIAEVVDHGKTGFVVQPTKESLARAICRLLDDPEGARRMGIEGRRRVESHFSEAAYLQKLIAVLRDVAALQPGSQRAPVCATTETP